VTLGAKGRDTSAAAADAAAGALAGGADTDLAGAVFFADFFFGFFGALFLAFFFAPRFGAFFALFFFFLPAAFLRADFFRFAPFFRADFPRFAGLRAARLRLLFLRAAMCSLPRDAKPAPCAARILRSPLACLPCKWR
jgi:hypothetical protein